MNQDGEMVRTSGHLGSDGKAEDVANDSVDADVVGETWLQLRDGDTTPISRHPLLELMAPQGRRLVRDHIFRHCHRPVPFQFNGPVADTSHSQVLWRGNYQEAIHRQHELRGLPFPSPELKFLATSHPLLIPCLEFCWVPWLGSLLIDSNLHKATNECDAGAGPLLPCEG